MCGILGIFEPNKELNADSRMAAGMQALAHRGPDARVSETYLINNSVVHFGHTRLSIIDLTDSGRQPMHGGDGRYSIVFNGEIYNYKELRKELQSLGCAFISNSDTEVLLTAWAIWGEACLPRLVGMFAFAVLDRVAATITCVRDAFGIKPFFYAQENDAFLFASEITALKALKRNKVALDWQRAYDYLVHSDYDSGDRSFIDGVRHLLPGHLMRLDLSSGSLTTPSRWWSPQIQERTDLSFSEATDLVREKFLDSIRMHLRSDVPLGAALSGGIDSSAVVCAMRHIEPDLPINTFSYIAQGSALSEEVWVDRVNQYVGANAHKVVVSGDELARDLDDMIQAQGEPFGSTSIYAQYRVFRLARERGVTVTLDGQGADEMLAGYNGYPGARIRSLVDKGQFAEAWHFLNEWAKWPGRSRIEGVKRVAGQMTQGWLFNILHRLNGRDSLPSWIQSKPLIERGIVCGYPTQNTTAMDAGRRLSAELAFSLTQRGLPSLLRHGDRNSMRFSVESRVPFLTLDMVNLLLSLPEPYLISPQGETKSVFRAAMRGIVPSEILDRRDKIGFATPEQEWLLGMASSVRQWLSDDLGLPFFDQAAVLAHFDKIVAGQEKFTWQTWRWINFCRWYKIFIN